MLNVAIIGTQNISAMHIRAYLAFSERCRIVALVDIQPEHAQTRKDEFKLDQATVYASHKEMLERGDIDLVSICTPPFTHADLAIDCMRGGANVIVEKPMAASLEECDRIMEVEKETGRLLSAVAQNRFRSTVMKTKKLLDKDLIGKLLHIKVESHWWRGLCYYDLWWRGTWAKEGGGCTLNHAVHHIDLLNWMMGMPRQVVSVLSNLAHPNSEVEDLSVSVLTYDHTVATVTGSVIHHGEKQEMVFQGEKAMVSFPFDTYASLSKDNGFPERNEVMEAEIRKAYESIPSLLHENHAGQIGDVLSALERKRKPLVTSQDGRNTIELITAIYKAGSTGLPVTLPISADDPWYTAEGIINNATHFYEKTGNVMELGGSDIKT